MCDCPFLSIQIDEGACYDINMVKERMVKRVILDSMEREFNVKISLVQAELICPKCKYRPF